MNLFSRGAPAVGLEIGTNMFRAVQLKSAPGPPVLAHYGAIRVPVGSVVDGEIMDVEAIWQSIVKLWQRAKIREKRVIIGVANQKVVIRLAELPFMPKIELKTSIRYQAQEFIPIPIEETILDFQVVREFVDENGDKKMEILLVAAQKGMVGNCVAAVEKAGLKPEVVDITSFAMARSLMSQLPIIPDENVIEKEEAVALVNVGAGITNIVVVEKGIPKFTRVTSVAGNNFTQAIADSLSCSFDEAEELKIKIGLPPLAGEEPQKVPKEMEDKVVQVQDILKNETAKFNTEVKRSLDYYLAQASRVGGIGKAIFSGAGSRLANFLPYIEKNLGVGIEIGHPLEKVKISSRLSEKEIRAEESSLAIPIGLALRGFKT